MNASINYYKTANEFKQKGDYDSAIENFKKALELEPDNLALYNDLGISYYFKKNYESAIKTYEKALEVNPAYAIACNNLGIIYFDMQNFNKAIENYIKAITINPNYIDAYNNIGNIYSKFNQYDKAIENYRKALQLNPNDVKIYNNLGLVLHASEDHKGATENYKKALQIDPNYANTYNNLGFVYVDIKEIDIAINILKKAIELNPQNAEAYNNLGLSYYEKRLFDLSISHYKKAIELKQDFAEAYSNLSAVYLINGDCETGFDLYESRFKTNGKMKICLTDFPKPKWDGSSIENKTLYVYYEQGFGDTIMFSRYLPVLKSMGAKILFKPQKELANLLRANNLKAEIINFDTPDESIEFDEHIPLVSLPRILKTNLENIPYSNGYLKASSEKENYFKDKYFKDNNKFKIGIFWQGNLKGMKERATSLKNFYKLSETENVEIYSLQKGYGTEQLDELPDSIKIIDLGSVFNDYSDTAAAIANLDLIITIDSSVAHLAGAMNKPTWLLLPKLPEWRWLLDREDTPWYTSIKLFRQKEKNDWKELFDRVYCELNTNLGHLSAGKKEFKLAVDYYNNSLNFNQNLSDVDLYNNLGVCYHNIKQYELAVTSYKKVIELKPGHVESYCNLGVAYSYLEKLEESELCYKKVIELNPEYADAYYNLAILDTKQNKIKESLINYEKSIKADPNPNRIFNLSMNCLLSGDYEKGLKLYEIRTELENYKLLNIPTFNKPKWDGKSFEGKTLYVYSEQGFGDSIQFSRYIFQLKNLGGKILFKPQAGLEKLFRQSNLPAEIIDNNVKNEDINFDIHCSVVSLPYLLDARPDNIPSAKKYLYSDAETVAFYKEKYFNNDKFKIGIKWQGNAVGDINRAASLENFYKLAKLENVKLYSLQKDFGIEQLKDKSDNIDIVNLGDTFKDFADTAAAVENMDLIITIDTSVAHLAGAMNKPTWILIPYCPEWRWLLGREDTPWYKSAKLFRQKERNNWEEVMDRVFEELKKKTCAADFEYYFQAGKNYCAKKNYDAAINSFECAASIKPDNDSVYHELGLSFFWKNDFLKAAEIYEKAIGLNPDNSVFYYNLGVSYLNSQKYDQASENFKKNLELNPSNADSLNNMGIVFNKKGEYEKAVENHKKAIALNPENPNFYINLGLAYINGKEHGNAIEAYNRAIELNPNDAEFYNNLGVCYYKNYQFDLAIDNYNKAISLRPDFVEAYSNLSHLCIMNGNFEEGWKYYEWRFKQKDIKHLNIPKFQTPMWDSKNSIKNKTIYVYWEQGYGDTLMFCRYLPVLHAMGAKVLFKPQPALENLLRENDLKAEIISPSVSDETIQFDEYASLMSLPYLLKTTLENIPYPEGYLKADPEKVKIYKEKYFNNNLFKVGIFWQGNPKGMKERATDLKNFYKLSEIENVELYSLQKGYGIEQLKELPDSIKITDLGSVFNDYSDTAAAISNLDLVITIDTSVAHLAAAMNKPTWMLLPYFPEWRWIRDRDDTPWYKSIKLFRQKEKNNWEEVMDRVCKELANKQLYNIK